MKGDFSRLTFDRRKRYSGVLMQQGRVQTDADWNEQLEIQHRRTEMEARDVIGLCGVPKETGGFEIQALDSPAPLTPFDLSVSDGRIYVDGLLCESDASKVALSSLQGMQGTAATLDVDGRPLRPGQWVTVSGDDGANSTRLIVYVDEGLGVLTFDANLPNYQDSDHPYLKRVTTYLTQPDLASPEFAEPPDPDAPVQLPSLKLPEGHYLAYLRVFERHVTALDDPLIREKALGGPDTTTRIKNVWQLGLLPVAAPNNQEVDCESQLPEWDALVAPPTGLMNARTEPEDDPKDPCLLPPEAGYRRLENQLYRVEVHRGGPRASASFKWSRENGSIQTNVEKVNGTKVTVSDLGRDEVLGFSGGQWVEVVDDESELTAAPRPLALITKVTKETREITLDADITALEGRAGLRLRRWDQPGDEGTADGLPMAAGWLDIEGGIQVEFSEGTYRAGDYWLIPARTATADIEWPPYGVPNETPQPQPPRGVKHHYCRLALLFSNDDGVAVVEDCRKLFPPLTHICAEDVCFDNTHCDMPNVETVQEAIDHLCQARDLRFHNKHLHGWGIVCGLQVNCGPDDRAGRQRRHVTVRKGYAIDCEGNDIIHEADEPLDLVGMIEKYDEQHPNAPLLSGDGEVCLVLTGDDDNRYAVERYDPASEGFNSIFTKKNTLLSDFLEDCLGKLVEAVQKEFSNPPGQAKGLVSAAQKRWTTLFNLLIQLFNKTNGRYVYLSGEKGLEDLRTEHTILKNLYESLRGLIQSQTFCGMFDETEFPEYPYASLNGPSKDPLYIPTVFGKGFHRRLRIHPNGRTAYTCGLGNKIHVYDLVSNEMVEELKFPDDGAQVHDVAFSQEGAELYAVATLNGKDSFFAVAAIGGTGHEWKSSSIVCDVQLVTLGTRKKVPGKVYAAGKGKGLYEINVGNVQPNLQPILPFNLAGHLVIVEKGTQSFAFMTARTPGFGPPNVYDMVLRYDLVSQQSMEIFNLTIGGEHLTGQDDIAVAYDAKPTPLLYVVVNPPSFSNNKQLLVFDARGPQFGQPILPWMVDLEENTAVRLAYNYETRNLMLTFADSYRVRLVWEDTNEITTTYQLDQNFRYPVQVSPMAIAVGPDPQGEGATRVYVLNSASNTINSAPASRFKPSRQIPLQPLVDYRAAVLEAFVRLFGGLLQYLKDCLCDHLLVDCPECGRDDKIYLACVQIREGSVYKICNFSKRKYVKSFPTVEYWLSAVPVLPLVGKAVEKLCCAVLPEWFGRYTASKTVQSPNVLTSAMLHIATSALKGGSVQALVGKQFGGLGDAFAKLVRDWFVCASREDGTFGGVAREDLIGRRMEDVKGLVRDSINVVGVDEYDPCDGLQNFLRLFTAPSRLAEGSNVRLVVEDGTIRNYTTVAGATGRSVPLQSDEAANVEPAQTFAAALRQTETPPASSASGEEVRSLREELAAMREEFDRARAEYERNLEELKQQVGALAQKRPPRKSKAE
ncbi:MAG TPA: DUF6519 domain-containing protein [Pyrinomonadaceae bacterium]|nr:DUF6519 domain-containing protein [Pyrinomonadaceae bacterium]